jgi:hypothetical protein
MVVAGIDVGEDFLDVATFSPARRQLSLAQVDLRTIGATQRQSPRRSQFGTSPIGSLRETLAKTVPALNNAIVLVDSPRWPRDLDWSKTTSAGCRVRTEQKSKPRASSRAGAMGAANPVISGGARQSLVSAAASCRPGREIDAALRALILTLRKFGRGSTLAPLSMFPTPPMRYFGAHLNLASCKPHLRLLGQELFGEMLNRDHGPAQGGTFTRFMIAGFATYQALDTLAAEVYESYPDLQFKLWSGRQRLLAKNSTSGRSAALASRVRLLCILARKVGLREFDPIQRMDAADAAVLALSTAAAQKYGATLVVQSPREGAFMVALDNQMLNSLA